MHRSPENREQRTGLRSGESHRGTRHAAANALAVCVGLHRTAQTNIAGYSVAALFQVRQIHVDLVRADGVAGRVDSELPFRRGQLLGAIIDLIAHAALTTLLFFNFASYVSLITILVVPL